MTQVNDVPPPGDYIREELEAREWSQRDLAYVLGVSEQSVNLLIAGKRSITADMARALGEAFDVPAELFANLQRTYDLAHARIPDPNVRRKGRLQSSYPVREMIKRDWLIDSDEEIEMQMASFFEVENADQIPHISHAAKKTNYSSIPPAQLAWLFRVRKIAREMVVPEYSPKRVPEMIKELRLLMIAPEEARKVPRILAEYGIRYVIVECLPGAKIDGVCFWLDDGSSPVIGMSIRHDRIDNFWFVLFHEIEHVRLCHGRDAEIIDAELEGSKAGTGEDIPEDERQANAGASERCVPKKELESFIARKQPYFSERDMIAFAMRLNIHPGIVAGQLRNRTQKWNLFTRYLEKIRSVVTATSTVDGWGEVADVTG